MAPTTPTANGARQVAAIILAIGLVTALNIITLAALWTAVHGKSDVSGGLSENATQVLTGVMGGIIGVLGSYMGFKAGTTAAEQPPPPEPREPGSRPTGSATAPAGEPRATPRPPTAAEIDVIDDPAEKPGG